MTARDSDALDHVERIRSGAGRPGWVVILGKGTPARRFYDGGDPPAALRRAIAWRDRALQRQNAQRGQLLGRTGLGVGG